MRTIPKAGSASSETVEKKTKTDELKFLMIPCAYFYYSGQNEDWIDDYEIKFGVRNFDFKTKNNTQSARLFLDFD